MIEWAAANLSEADRDWYNSVIHTEQAPLAVEALWARYTRAKGNPPKTMLRGGRSVDTEDVYESQTQLDSFTTISIGFPIGSRFTQY